MKVELEPSDGGTRIEAQVPFHGATRVEVGTPCPSCEREAPLKLVGKGTPERGHDTYTCRAEALCCGATLGKLIVTMSTIFGLEEDERVLNGRCRVY